MRIKESKGRQLFMLLNTLFMTALVLVCLYPMIYVLFASVSESNELMAHSGLLLKPIGFNMNAYAAVIKNPMIGRGYLNTLFVVFVGVTISMLLTILGAYFLSRRDIMLKNAIMALITMTMFFGGGLIPFYMVVKAIGLYDKIWSMILPCALNTFNLIVMRTSFQALPNELEEAAAIDGAGELTLIFRIIVPLSKAIIAVMILFYGVSMWNAWFYASLFLNNRNLFPLQLVLREILLQNDTSSMTQGVGAADSVSVAETVKYAVIIVSTVPILCVYPFLQKYFAKGVMVGAVKG